MWAVLTRLEQPKHASLTLLQKLKLYNGKTLPGFTEDNVIELQRGGRCSEGMHGIRPRYIQDKISNALVAHPDEDNINPFMVLQRAGDRPAAPLADHQRGAAASTTSELLARGQGGVRGHREERSAAGHRRRRGRPARGCARNYIDNVKAYTQREKVRNKLHRQTTRSRTSG